jgi:hypothetical protein
MVSDIQVPGSAAVGGQTFDFSTQEEAISIQQEAVSIQHSAFSRKP